MPLKVMGNSGKVSYGERVELSGSISLGLRSVYGPLMSW